VDYFDLVKNKKKEHFIYASSTTNVGTGTKVVEELEYKNYSRYRQFHLLPLAPARGLKVRFTSGL